MTLMRAGARWRLALGGAALLGLVGLLLTQFAGHDAAIDDLGAVLLVVALLCAIFTIMLRLGPASGPDRDRELLARDEYERTGHWPEE